MTPKIEDERSTDSIWVRLNSSSDHKVFHLAMLELLTTPTKAQCAPVNLPPPTHHLSPHYYAPPHHTFYFMQNRVEAGLAVSGQLSEEVN